MKVTFIGGGNMAAAMIGGMIAQGMSSADIHAVDISPETRERLSQEFKIQTFAEATTPSQNSDVLILAVKPQQMAEVAKSLQSVIDKQLIITIAAGIQTSTLSRWLAGYKNVVRVMPNTPALVRAGFSGLYADSVVNEQGRKVAQDLLNAIGETLWFEREEQLDSVTALSGSGPAYVFYFIEAMEEAGRKMGLSPEASRLMSVQTIAGAVKLAAGSQDTAQVLRQKVTSKGGTTERALKTMEQADIKNHFIAAILAAEERSRELGNELGASV